MRASKLIQQTNQTIRNPTLTILKTELAEGSCYDQPLGHRHWIPMVFWSYAIRKLGSMVLYAVFLLPNAHMMGVVLFRNWISDWLKTLGGKFHESNQKFTLSLYIWIINYWPTFAKSVTYLYSLFASTKILKISNPFV